MVSSLDVAAIVTFDDLLAAALDGLYIGRDSKALMVARAGRIISANPLAATLCGSTPEALIRGYAIADLFDEPAEALATTRASVQRWESLLRTAAGGEVPIEVVREPLGSRLPGVLVYAVRDLRERLEAAAERERKNRALRDRERQLSVQNERFDTAINNMPQGLAMFDASRQLLVCNARFGGLYGIEPENLAPGITLGQLMQRSQAIEGLDRRAAEADRLCSLVDGMSLVQQLAGGRLLAVSRRSMADGGLVLTTEDITERERDKQRLNDYAAKLEGSNGELQSFAYVASHDLQEPLRKIQTFVDRIVRRHGKDLSPEIVQPLERIQDAAGRMRRLINDLLGFARLGNENKPFTRVCLNETMNSVVSDLQIRIEETKAQIETTELPTIEADPTLIRQLLQNLVSNALKFSRKDVAPVIKVATDMRRAADGSECLVLTVADNGIGFDNRFKEQIFQIFQRLHGRQEFEGTGVGLATCRKIVDRHGGAIDADGRPGEGATFTVVFPASRRMAA